MNSVKCFLNIHNLEVYKEEEIMDRHGNIIGKVIINRCKNCGKLYNHRVILSINYNL